MEDSGDTFQSNEALPANVGVVAAADTHALLHMHGLIHRDVAKMTTLFRQLRDTKDAITSGRRHGIAISGLEMNGEHVMKRQIHAGGKLYRVVLIDYWINRPYVELPHECRSTDTGRKHTRLQAAQHIS
jgi:hypothetical protein